MDKKIKILTSNAPEAIGPYSQAIRSGDLIFVSGQIPLTPEGEPCDGEGIAAETRQVLENLRAVLKEAGASMESVIKTTVYMTELSVFPEMNAVYEEFFIEPYPARATVGVKELPKGVLVEIEAIAIAMP
jgi:2-iminobutanoate/2-iminopropanoate deaminase